jgi:hypothetical protein
MKFFKKENERKENDSGQNLHARIKSFAFHCLMLSGTPFMQMQRRNERKRLTPRVWGGGAHDMT